MAKNLEDPAFWLPSEFLCDDFFLDGGEKKRRAVEDAGVGDVCFSGELPYGFVSNPSSLVESVTVTDSDEEDHMAGLTQKMSHCFLQDDDKLCPVFHSGDEAEMRMMVGSPQSTLSAWSATGKGSLTGLSLVSSPLSSPTEHLKDDSWKDDSWNVLYEAAGQVIRLRLNEQSVHGRGLLGPPGNSSISIPAPSRNPHIAGYCRAPVLTKQQMQAAQFHHLKQQQLMKQQLSAAWGRQGRPGFAGGGAVYGGEGRCPARLIGPPPPHLQKQQQPPQLGSGMRAIFLTGPGARRESAGTGVFLPRRVGTPTESLKKPACSTVLLPARVVHALNLIPDDLGAEQRSPGGFVLDHDALVGQTNNPLSLPKRNLHPQPAVLASHDVLPQEWTY